MVTEAESQFSHYLDEILVNADKCNVRDTLALSKHIWHQIVTDGTEESYLIVAVSCMAVSMKRFLPDKNMFAGDLLTSLSEQSRGKNKKQKQEANRLAVDLINAPLSVMQIKFGMERERRTQQNEEG